MTSLPVAANTTCDIYNPSDPGYPGPGGSPSSRGLAIFLQADYEGGLFAGDESQSPEAQCKWTHWCLVPGDTYVQDGFAQGGTGFLDSNCARLWVPRGSDGTAFVVVFVERLGPGTPGDQKKLYLRRLPPTWPTSYL